MKKIKRSQLREWVREEIQKLNEVKLVATNINNKIKKDVMNTIGSFTSLNAPHAMGYLFDDTEDGTAVGRGMYCDSKSEIKNGNWDYYLDFKTKKFYKIK